MSDRLHLGRGTGTVHVNEIDGAWFARRADRLDPLYSPFERWFDSRFMPTLERLFAWVIAPAIGWVVVYHFARWVLSWR